MAEQSPGLREAVRQMAELRHGDSAMFYASEIMGLIETHHHLKRLSNAHQGLTPEQQAQRKALLNIPIMIVRQEIRRMFKDYFLPEYNLWEANADAP